MNGIHDCGGMQGLGTLYYSETEPVFRQPWEGRVLAMSLAEYYAKNAELTVGFRPPIESIPALDYLGMNYFEIWFTALVERLVGSGLITREELKVGRSLATPEKKATPASPEEAVLGLLKPDDEYRSDIKKPRYKMGAPVKARNFNPMTHTRLPRYVRGKAGTVVRQHGTYVFPDTDEYNLGENPNHVYCVKFSARELWGKEASPKDFVYVDLWEKYLDPA